MSELIAIENVWKRYLLGETPNLATLVANVFLARKRTPVWALQDVSLRINKGETVGLIGLNGSGKTTLLRTLARVTKPTSGTITTRGRVAALIALGAGFHHELTGHDNIFLNGAILGMRKKEHMPHLELLWVVFLMFVAQLMLMSGLGFLLAPLNLAYRDISNMLPLVLPLFLFITPVVFAGDQVPERFQFLNVINPMALIIEISRGALLDGTVPASSEIALVFGIASAFMLVGYLVFRVVEPIFADIV